MGIPKAELRKLARTRLKDARVLFDARRYDGAIYLAGYVVELALKARICRTLKWDEFPLSSNEFKGLTSFKTHDLDRLLRLSGVAEQIRTRHFVEWTLVQAWQPEFRYRPRGTATQQETRDMLQAIETILGACR